MLGREYVARILLTKCYQPCDVIAQSKSLFLYYGRLLSGCVVVSHPAYIEISGIMHATRVTQVVATCNDALMSVTSYCHSRVLRHVFFFKKSSDSKTFFLGYEVRFGSQILI